MKPWQLAAEHAALGCSLALCAYLWWRQRRPGAHLEAIAAIKRHCGPPSVLQWLSVREAPPPSMDVDALDVGEVASHTDARGAIYRFKLGEKVIVNLYHTKAGYRRSGDLHDCDQYDVVLKGKTRLRMVDPLTGKESVQDFDANDFIVIPARTPHMFEFLEDNFLLEWWDDEFRAWYYEPYRRIIEQGLPLSATEDSDFSVRIGSMLLRQAESG